MGVLRLDCASAASRRRLGCRYGFYAADLRGIYTVKDMRDQGFSLDELREGGVPEQAVRAVDGRPTRELRKAGYLTQILRKIGFLLCDARARFDTHTLTHTTPAPLDTQCPQLPRAPRAPGAFSAPRSLHTRRV